VGDLILQTDAAVGAVLDTLQKLGLDKNTLVIFTSDNGHGPSTGVPALLQAGHDPSRPFRGYKGSLLEGGHRIPFIVRWPGKVRAGVVCDELISLNSLMATCAELTSAQLPANAGEDSHSILRTLVGNRVTEQMRENVEVHAGRNGFAVRRGPWKLVESKAKRPTTKKQDLTPDAFSGLYNVQIDPAEMTNVMDQYPDLARELKALRNKLVGTDRMKSKLIASQQMAGTVTDDEDVDPATAKT